jgi:SAM-dependent methyltransferase
MRTTDRILQSWRVQMARPWIPAGANVLDIGCHQGELFESLEGRIGPSVGYDPLAIPREGPRYRLVPESFREPMPFDDESFDAIVMLATLEHIRDKSPLGREGFRLLRPCGRLIITVPSPAVDRIVSALHWLRLVDGMSLEEHHGFAPRTTPEIFGRYGFELEHRRRFQLGLNYLYVLRKSHSPQSCPIPAAVGIGGYSIV